MPALRQTGQRYISVGLLRFGGILALVSVVSGVDVVLRYWVAGWAEAGAASSGVEVGVDGG